VPLVIAGIDDLAPGIAGLVDVAPTVLSALGRHATGLDGRDLRASEDAVYRSSNPLYGPPEQRAARRGDAKALADGVDPPAGFDLRADPGEVRALAPAPALLAALPPPLLSGDAAALDPALEEGLRALGYVE
jgi:arylsulfatase A-like enzyme